LRDAVSAVAPRQLTITIGGALLFFAKDICIALAALMKGTRPPRLPKEQLPEQGEAEIGPALKQWR
jgi:hypothetical protein